VTCAEGVVLPLSERLATAPHVSLHWPHTVRIVATAYPSVDRFDRIAPPDDFAALTALESETNARLSGVLSDSLPHGARHPRGPGAAYVMAAFAHVSPWGSRFAAPGAYGVYYAARDEATAIAETVYHRERLARESRDPPMAFDQRVLVATIAAHAVDLRGLEDGFPDVYDRERYDESQRAGRLVLDAGGQGIAFDSVRLANGECIAVFHPSCITRCRHTKYLSYRWDGERITVLNVSLARRAQRGRGRGRSTER